MEQGGVRKSWKLFHKVSPKKNRINEGGNTENPRKLTPKIQLQLYGTGGVWKSGKLFHKVRPNFMEQGGSENPGKLLHKVRPNFMEQGGGVRKSWKSVQ